VSVEPSDAFYRNEIEDEGLTEDERIAIESAGVEAALEYESRRQRHGVRLDHLHPGWDIESYEIAPATGSIEEIPSRFIEVKAKRSAWEGWGVGLTRKEWEHAGKKGADYYLYVVEYALDPAQRHVYVFRDPVAKMGGFRFAGSWRRLADEEEGPSLQNGVNA
jgi:hypothetical protein